MCSVWVKVGGVAIARRRSVKAARRVLDGVARTFARAGRSVACSLYIREANRVESVEYIAGKDGVVMR